MRFSKSPKLLPVCNFVVVARGAVGQRQNVSGFSFTLQPQVNRVSADVELPVKAWHFCCALSNYELSSVTRSLRSGNCSLSPEYEISTKSVAVGN